MSRRRSRLEIMLDILAAVRGGIDKPTNIIYAVRVRQRIISNLTEQGLLEVRMTPRNGSSKRRYMITEKGVNMLDFFEKANEILPNGFYQRAR